MTKSAVQWDEINKESGEYIIRLHKVVNYKTRGTYTKKKEMQKKQTNEHIEIVRRIIRGYKAIKRSDPDKNYFVYTW